MGLGEREAEVTLEVSNILTESKGIALSLFSRESIMIMANTATPFFIGQVNNPSGIDQWTPRGLI